MKLNIWTLSLSVIGATALIGWNFAEKLPTLMASHWNLSNKVDGYMNKEWVLIGAPLLMLVLLVILLLAPRLDPKYKNIKIFQIYYEGFVLLMMLFLSYIHILAILYNLGYQINIGQLISPALAIFFTYIGFLMKNAKLNWTIGIRTPWTLSSEKNWAKTHKWVGQWLMLTSPLVTLGLFFPSITFLLLILPIFFILSSIVYSYLVSKHLA